MGFGKFINTVFKAAFSSNGSKKSRAELGDDFDFREEYADVVEDWENTVNELSFVADDWDGESDPSIYRDKFNEEYANTLDYLKNTVKPFLADHSDGYKKSLINEIYKDLLEQTKEYKKDFFSDEFPRMVSDYKDFLEEQRLEEEEWNALTNTIIEKLNGVQPIKQKTFIDSFENKRDIKNVINELVENKVVYRVKKGGAYVISLVNKEAQYGTQK